jgi:hypothetical protein
MFWGIIFTTLGIGSLVFAEQLAKGYMGWQKYSFNYRSAPKNVELAKTANRVIGLLFVVIGILSLLGHITIN